MEKEQTLGFQMNANNFTIILMAILFAVSAFQTTQLTGLANTLAQQEQAISNLQGTGIAAGVGNLSTSPLTPSQQQAPTSLQNLPEMVGGC